MKFCKFCGKEMIGEFETNRNNSHKFKVFYNCQHCHAVCDGEYIENKNGKRIITEKWWNPATKDYD